MKLIELLQRKLHALPFSATKEQKDAYRNKIKAVENQMLESVEV